MAPRMMSTAANPTESADFVSVVRNLKDIADIVDCWRACCRHRDMDVEWYLQEISSAPTTRPYVLAYYRAGRPACLLIGRYELKRPDLRIGYFRVPVRKVRSLTFPIGALVGEASPAACQRFIDNIRASLAAGEVDAATIYHCEHTSPLAAIARTHAGAGDLFGRMSKVQVHRTRMLWEEQTSSMIGLSAGERQHQKRRRKMMRDLGQEARVVCFCSDDEVDRLMEEVETVAATTYQRGLRVGFVDTPQMRERLRFEARMGWLRAYVLYLADRPSAFWITNLYRGVLYSYFLGFDPAYARYSPGAYLMLEAIEGFRQQSARAPVRHIDFGVGEAEYKARFGNRVEQAVSLFMFAPNLGGLTLGALHRTVTACNSGAARLLGASGFLPRLKRAWRSRLRRA
jgi:ribosomal protein S18 acetylase RimI-like enzyme